MIITPLSTREKHAGAALIVALILLIALSLLAISSMNTATLDLIMAGNTQYKARAFTAAEAGLSEALTNGTFNTTTPSTTCTLTPTTPKPYGDDTYQYCITSANNGKIEPAPLGNSLTNYGGAYFRVKAIGLSKKSAQATVSQEIYIVVRNQGDETYNSGICKNTNKLEDSSSQC